MLTIQIPPELEQQLSQLAAQLNLPLETFILQSLQQSPQPIATTPPKPKFWMVFTAPLPMSKPDVSVP
jgi:hypothetical protein